VRNLGLASGEAEFLAPDLLFVDAYYERSEYIQRRIDLVKEQMQRRLCKGRITQEKADEELSNFANGADYQSWEAELLPGWEQLLPRLTLRPGVLVIMMGCNMHCGLYFRLKEELAKRGDRARPQSRKSDVVYRRTKESEVTFRRNVRRIRALLRNSTNRVAIKGATLTHHPLSDPNGRGAQLELLPLYIHHRIMVLRIN
jgi:hypothetical protein